MRILTSENRLRELNTRRTTIRPLSEVKKESESMDAKGLARRRLLTGAVGGLVVGAVAGAAVGSLGFPKTVTQTQTQTMTSTSSTTLGIPTTWDYQADVVIMGAGTSGLSAALEAAAAGAKVIVLEKEPSSALANSGHCAGTIVGVNSAQQTAAGITDSPSIYYAELTGPGSNPLFDPAVAMSICNNSGAAIAWLTQQGIQWAPYCPLLDGQSTAPRMMAALPDSSTYPATLNANAVKAGVQILYNTPVGSLYRDPVNGVVGLSAKATSGVINVKANRAVVLAAGDNAANAKMLAQASAIPSWFTTLPPEGSPGSTGDGIIAGMAVGAAPVALATAVTEPSFGFVVGNTRIVPDTSYGYTPGSTNVNAKLSAFAYQPAILSYAIYVNSAGNRYTNETGSTVAADTFALSDMKSFMIFDSAPANLNVYMHVSAGHTLFKEWLADGALAQADTLDGLASSLGINSSGLAAGVATWNGNVAANKDSSFGRTIFVSPISTGPFYGIPATLFSLELANGTLNVDVATQNVLDESGNPIPRLYAAGDNGRAGVMGGGHGTHMVWTFISGRQAGTSAASETSLA